MIGHRFRGGGMTERLLSVSEAARELGVSETTIRRWADEGILRTIRLPTGGRRFRRDEIERMKRAMGLLEGGESDGA